jgi:hypothetical protein
MLTVEKAGLEWRCSLRAPQQVTVSIERYATNKRK